MRHLDHLDGWRGLAIATVLTAHFVGAPWINAGRLGVDLFFVLSGVLMSRILYDQRVALATFYWRRISRILPVFLLFLAALYVFAHLRALQWAPGEIIASMLFLRTYFPLDLDIWETAVPAGHLWSLNVEEHSYVVLALIAAIPMMRGREGWVLMAMACACAAMVLWYWRTPDSPDDYMLRTETAALGLVLAAGYHKLKRHTERYVRAWMPLVALAMGVACYLTAVPDVVKALIAPACLAFAINHIGSTYQSVLTALRCKPLRMLGIWSYSLYLWQQPFYRYQDELAGLALPLAFAVGLLSYYAFESPMRKWLNGMQTRSVASVATA